nr:MAG TPA: Asparagine synthase [Caudoviricetes sp.]
MGKSIEKPVEKKYWGICMSGGIDRRCVQDGTA